MCSTNLLIYVICTFIEKHSLAFSWSLEETPMFPLFQVHFTFVSMRCVVCSEHKTIYSTLSIENTTSNFHLGFFKQTKKAERQKKHFIPTSIALKIDMCCFWPLKFIIRQVTCIPWLFPSSSHISLLWPCPPSDHPLQNNPSTQCLSQWPWHDLWSIWNRYLVSPALYRYTLSGLHAMPLADALTHFPLSLVPSHTDSPQSSRK